MDIMPTIRRATYVYPVHYACAIVTGYNEGVHTKRVAAARRVAV